MAAYATRKDLYRYGLARGALANSGMSVGSATAATDLFELESHGLETDDAVLVRAADGGTLPSPLVAGTTYYVIRISESTFKVAASAGGAAINLTTNGTSVIVTVPLPYDDVLEYYSRFVDDLLPAHIVPLESPYPVTVVATVAELAARRLQLMAGQSSESMAEIEVGAKAKLERWAKAIPLRDSAATGPTNLAIVSTSTGADPRGWGSGSLP